MKAVFHKVGDVSARVVADIVFHLKGMDAKMYQLREELRQERIGSASRENRLRGLEQEVASLKEFETDMRAYLLRVRGH